MRSLCAQPVVCRASAAQPARLRAAAPLHAALPAHRRPRSAALHVAARPVTAAVAVRAACFCACAPGATLTSRASCARQAPPPLPYRVGHGFDLHRLAPGLKLILGGVDIPHTKGCEAHSDGALTRATASQHFALRRWTDRAATVRKRLHLCCRCARRGSSTRVSLQALRLSDAAECGA